MIGVGLLIGEVALVIRVGLLIGDVALVIGVEVTTTFGITGEGMVVLIDATFDIGAEFDVGVLEDRIDYVIADNSC